MSDTSQDKPVTILAISGSLRGNSANTLLLRAAAMMAPSGIVVTPYDGLGTLPHFNPDLDSDPAPPPVRDLRERVAAAEALLISSPEYAHGVPGTLKNALDWLVSGIEIVGKPVGLLNASPRAFHAQDSLREILRTMAADVLPQASVTIPLSGRGLDLQAIVADADAMSLLVRALTVLEEAAAR